MPQLDTCEICGREAYHLVKRKVEGSIIMVCDNCKDLGEEPFDRRKQIARKASTSGNTASFHSIVNTPTRSSPRMSTPSSRPITRKKIESTFEEYRVRDDATAILLKTRTSQGLSIDQFAESIKIKGNYYNRIEKGTTGLSLDLAKTIERVYKISLLEKEASEEEPDVMKQYSKKGKAEEGGMIYFRKRGQKPEYD
jgi:uncharacterized protein (TIGR00270 family)